MQGAIETIDILSKGSGYSIGEKVIFDNTGTNGVGLDAEVKKLHGKPIDNNSSTVITL